MSEKEYYRARERRNIDRHRSHVVITCPEDCWCWDEEARLNEIEAKE